MTKSQQMAKSRGGLSINLWPVGQDRHNKWRTVMFLILFCNQINSMPKPSYAKLPRWRGFNLLEKFKVSRNQPYVEKDFQLISKWGFNFVRLPIDYRCYIKEGNWKEFDEKNLKEIDQAIAWGKKYGIHVCINLHRAPGYCVNPPKEPADLWTDPEAQEVCALHWAMFAKRYKKIPNEYLSFNLLNEPSTIDHETYYQVVKKLVEAIRKEDPKRLIIADGTKLATEPVPELVPLKIAQATRGYAPAQISHYKAPWVKGSDTLPPPTWPIYRIMPSHIYGPISEYHSPLIIKGEFNTETEFMIKVQKVSHKSKLVIKADNKTVFEKLFEPGPGTGEWKKAIFEKKWNIYQNIYDKYYSAKIPAGTKEISIENIEGDWLTFSEIRLNPTEGNEIVLFPSIYNWGVPQGKYYLTNDGQLQPLDKTSIRDVYDKNWLWKTYIEPWVNLSKQGVGIIVGEWGAFKYTPHQVTLAWMEDCLKNWKKVGWGWALWNFRGSFGILDSGRTDVEYEDFEGGKLDRKMLELLQKY